jgi:hypothetical protein
VVAVACRRERAGHADEHHLAAAKDLGRAAGFGAAVAGTNRVASGTRSPTESVMGIS